MRTVFYICNSLPRGHKNPNPALVTAEDIELSALSPSHYSAVTPMLVAMQNIFKGGFYCFLMYCIQHCFICRPSDSTASEDAAIEPRIVATTALTVIRSNQSAKSQL
jgi:hypothetical protein